MAIPSPTIPSSTTSISAVRLNPTQNNKAFYINSGEIDVTNIETTMISVNDIGKRDILICLTLGSDSGHGDDLKYRFKNNGNIIASQYFYSGTPTSWEGQTELRYIIPANTSIEVTLDNMSSATARSCSVSGYGYYLENFQ